MPIARLTCPPLKVVFLRRAHVHTHNNNKQSRKNNSRFATRDKLRGRIYPRRHWQNFSPICNARQHFVPRVFPSELFVRTFLLPRFVHGLIKWRVICHIIRLNVIVWSWNDRWIGRILGTEKGNCFQVPRESRSMDKFSLPRKNETIIYFNHIDAHKSFSLFFISSFKHGGPIG